MLTASPLKCNRRWPFLHSHFEISVDGALRDAAVIRPSAVTQQINTEQRSVGLPLIRGKTNDTHVAIAPPTGRVARGWYLPFVVVTDGTPSVGD